MAKSESIRLVGYARVSTVGQETNLQIDALEKAGVSVIYQEKNKLCWCSTRAPKASGFFDER